MRGKVQRADFEIKALSLSGDWAYKVACEKFGAELVDAFPRFTRGPRKGMLKGYLCYIKTHVGGWAENIPGVYGHRGVLFPGTSEWKLAMETQLADPKGHSTVARWDHNTGAQVSQTPEQAQALFKAYGQEARYA